MVKSSRLLPAVVLITMVLVSSGPVLSQTFTSVFDPSNPVVTDVHTTAYTGSAWLDFNDDGLIDLIVAGFGQNFLYQNDGAGVFSVPAGNPISSDTRTYRGVTCADYDNDGDQDVFLAGSSSSSLYRNDAGTFVRVDDVNLGTTDTRGWSPSWVDYNDDGVLDLYITFPSGFVGSPNRPSRLLLGNGAPDYTFTLIDTGVVVTGLDPYTSGNWSDYDLDGDLDLWVGSGPASGTAAPDNIYRNLQMETGVEGFERYLDAPIATDNADGQVFNLIDFDNDGDFDVHRTNWGNGGVPVAERRNDLYRNDAGTFVAITTGTITTDQFVSTGSLWEDFDNDGDLDCYVANVGAIDNFYRNDAGTFVTFVAGAIGSEVRNHTGASAGDYDNDGDLDIFAVGHGSSQRSLYRNDTNNGNGWLKLNLVGIYSNSSAIGARVHLLATIDGSPVWQMREISAQNSFLGHSSLTVHFGLGDAALVDSIIIDWPSGAVFDSGAVAINQLIELEEFCTDTDGDGAACVDNCPDTFNPDQADSNNDGIGDACCCLGIRGNANSDPGDNVNIADITFLVSYLFGIPSGPIPSCTAEGNANGDPGESINIGDITFLTVYLFGIPSGPAPSICP